ncbi:valine--tRNA ligase [Candidatus Deferrimicrobium sp.]|uniref:valine--tRNA ligase n=1 Tax=Candidatus Deferrimicrobium sp. TaxID=3060586 RepID=UPI002ED1F6EF
MNEKGPEKEKPYDPKSVEERWYAAWIAAGSFHADPSRPGDAYSIVIPPPNVTGSLHMGHALNITLQDVLLRYARMNGRNALWLPGTDHAGIATQNVVERELGKEGISRQELGRAAFIERVWKWKEQSGGTILNQLKRLGAACDWERERFTMDEGLSRAVREAFVRLYRKGLVYRGRYIINWCPRCRTALSDLEVSYVEKKGALWYIRYPGMSGEEGVVVATTRPETMLGDTAVAVNPKDDRYSGRIGTTLRLPLMNRPIPVVADEMVDREFGTGAVKITPAHDVNDFEVARRHGLPSVRVIDESGAMTRDAGAFAGMDRFACRDAVVAKLAEEGLLVREEPYLHNIGHCYRCRTVVEPSESMQWFVKTKPLAAPAIRAVREGETRIVPAQWEKTYYEWMENIHDWCISRQIWWGHRIPAFHCGACGNTMVEIDPPTKCEACGETDLRQEEDVLDTWFSSGLWPFSTLGWPERTADLERYYPTSVLVTGFDILFFWVARMMMMGIEFTGKAPFRDVVIHALVRDARGEKMSKTRGNVIDPLAVIDRFGTDAFRFTLVALAAQGRDIRMSDDRVEGYRNFMNKLYQAGRFVRMHVDDATPWELPEDLPVTDRWILSRLQRVIDEVRRGIEEYRFNEAGSAFYQFVWHEFCDWYLEMIKPALSPEAGEVERQLQRAVLIRVYETILALGHPFIPFITEELWHALPGKRGLLYDRPYPAVDTGATDENIEDEMAHLMEVIRAVRNIRSELNVPPGKKVEVRLKGQVEEQKFLREHEEIVRRLARAGRVSYVDPDYIPVKDATAVVNDIEVCLPLEGLIDFGQEAKRLRKEVEKTNAEYARVAGQLGNTRFTAKAPLDIIDALRDREKTLEQKLTKLGKNLELVSRYLA